MRFQKGSVTRFFTTHFLPNTFLFYSFLEIQLWHWWMDGWICKDGEKAITRRSESDIVRYLFLQRWYILLLEFFSTSKVKLWEKKLTTLLSRAWRFSYDVLLQRSSPWNRRIQCWSTGPWATSPCRDSSWCSPDTCQPTSSPTTCLQVHLPSALGTSTTW